MQIENLFAKMENVRSVLTMNLFNKTKFHVKDHNVSLEKKYSSMEFVNYVQIMKYFYRIISNVRDKFAHQDISIY